MKKENVYEGNVEVTKKNEKEWAGKLAKITKITGYVRAYNGSISAPLLKEVGGDVRADNGSKLELPKVVGKNPTPIRNTFLKKGYLLADNILSRIVSKKKSGEVTIYRTRKIGIRTKTIFVAQKGELFSHGETVKQAIHDLRYKLDGNRDTSEYKGWTVDSQHSVTDLIGAYRTITGACEFGVRDFCEGKDIPEKMSVSKAIELTRGAYRAEVFAAFFKGEK